VTAAETATLEDDGAARMVPFGREMDMLFAGSGDQETKWRGSVERAIDKERVKERVKESAVCAVV